MLAKASRAFADFSKDCFGETPKPTRETRALPGTAAMREHRECCRQLQAGSLRSPDKGRERKGKLLRALFERIRLAAQVCEGFAGEMERAGDQDALARSLRSRDRFGN